MSARPQKASAEDYLGATADEALVICMAMREDDPHRTLSHLSYLCGRHPDHAARIMMILATWVDVDGPLSALTDRAAAVAAGNLCPVRAAS